MDRTPVIVGTGLSDYPKAPDLDGVQHHVQAFQRALADSGLEKSEINGYVSAGGGGIMIDDAVTMAEYLRIDHRYIDGTMTGGSSFEFHVQHLAAAIREGLCDVALITYGSDQLSRMGRKLGTGGFQRPGSRVAGPDPVRGAVRQLARRCLRHARRPAHARVRHDPGAARGDRRRRPGVRRAQPARHLPRPDHGRRRAGQPHDRRPAAQARLLRDHRRRRRHPHDDRRAGRRTCPSRRCTCSARPARRRTGTSASSPTSPTCAGALAGPVAFERAGLTPNDIDVLQFYDSFTITCLILLESLGFVPRRARAARSSPRATSSAGAASRSTPTAAGCRRRTPGCAASSCSSRRRGSCAARPARPRCRTAARRSVPGRAAG